MRSIQLLAVGAGVAQAAQQHLAASIVDYMPTVTATVQSKGPFQFNLDNNALDNLAWSINCLQSLNTPDQSCGSEPTNVTPSLDDTSLTGNQGPFTDFVQSGYTTSGNTYRGDITFTLFDTTLYSQTEDINSVTRIKTDAWTYGASTSSGAIAVSGEAFTITNSQMTSASDLLIESGPVADQSFAGGAALTTPTVYIGGGDYSTLYPATSAELTLTPNADQTFNLSSAGFGVLNFLADVPESGYFQQLGYTNQTQTAVISANIRGIGLPTYLWYQVANLIGQTDPTVQSDLSCSGSLGGFCSLAQACAIYTNLWTFSFKVQFEGQTNYLNVPLGAFAADNAVSGGCDIYIEYLESATQPNSTHVVFGSMFLQQYINWWHYDYTTSPTTTTLSMQLSTLQTLTGSYIGNAQIAIAPSPFVNFGSTVQNLAVTTNSTTMRTTINAALGFQGYSEFDVALLGQFVQAWSSDCLQKFAGTLNTPCSSYPSFAELYFNQSEYTQFDPTEGDYDGYATTGYIYNTSICLQSQNATTLCTVQNHEVYISDTITQNHWNYGVAANAGSLGFNKVSPVWQIFGNPADKNYDVQLANFNDWASWADSSYVAPSTTSSMNINGFTSEHAYTGGQTIKPTIGGTRFAMDEFSFGITFPNATSSYSSILNTDSTLGIMVNQSTFAMNYRGLGLPQKSYEHFSNLLAVVTQGESSCVAQTGGYCVLANQCSYYQDKGLWDFDFKIKFTSETDQRYFRVPLATFVSNTEIPGACVVFVEYLNSDFDNDSKQVIFGGMFFQSVYAQFSFTQVSAVSANLYVNYNALSGTYLGSDVTTNAPDVFTVKSMMLQTDSNTERNGLPTFSATLAGITDPSPYYMLDLTSDRSIFWGATCVQSGSLGSAACNAEPTLMEMGFDPANNSSGLVRKTGDFANARFGGYVASGSKYTTKFCLANNICKLLDVYAATSVSQDNWLYGADGTYGIIGLGPNSGLWTGFTDPVSLTSNYSISLARIASFASIPQSNITLGGVNIEDYTQAPYANVLALANYSYGLNNFDFGIVYQTNGVDTSEYFQSLQNTYPVSFTTNFVGMGLPADVWESVTSLIQIVSHQTATCSKDPDGVCELNEQCAAYTAFSDYTFRLNFTNSTDNFYIRVPLATFAQDISLSGGVKHCLLQVQYLEQTGSQTSNIILGGQFFQEFFAVFQNDHSVDPPTQRALLTPNENAIFNAYAGNETLPIGVNPFIVPTKYVAQNENMMLTIQGAVQSQGPYWFNLEATADYNIAWSDNCLQNIASALPSACGSAPTLVTESISENALTGEGLQFDIIQSGFEIEGTIFNGQLSLYIDNAGSGSTTESAIEDVYVVNTIRNDAWNYGNAVSSGVISLSGNSSTIIDLMDPASQMSGFAFETGPVANQSFAGGSETMITPKLFIGGGSYQGIYPDTTSEVVLTPASNGSIGLSSVGFGVMNFSNGLPSSAFFEELGYTNQSVSALIAPNMKGVGIPSFLWYQLVNLLYRTSDTIQEEMTCTTGVDGVCSLPNECSAYTIWNYSLQVQFKGVKNYLIVPLGALAINNQVTGGCDIYLQLLDDRTQPESTQVVFGSMFLQQYIAWWSYDYSAGFAQSSIHLQLSSTCTLNNSYIGFSGFQPGPSPFISLANTMQTLNVTVDPIWKTTTVKASLGFQEYADFGISLLSNYIQTYSQDCQQKFAGTRFTPCSNSPSFLETYFNGTIYDQAQIYEADYSGYDASGYIVNSSICLNSNNMKYFCTISNDEFGVADSIYKNLWNYGVQSGAGNIGLGLFSAVWQMFDEPQTIYYDIYMSNFSDYSVWYQPGYSPVTKQSVINLNGYDTSYDNNANLVIAPTAFLGHSYELTEFSFGKTYQDNTKSYRSILNSQQNLGTNVNQTIFALDFRGLGLPSASFEEFDRLLSVITSGQSSCVTATGGYCVLAKPCASYQTMGLWNFDFRIMFAGNGTYFRIPLASFAIDNADSTCSIMVEYLEDDQAQGQTEQIILGGMFFQQVYARVYQDQDYYSFIGLYRNKNALTSTYFGSAVVPNGVDAFKVHVADLNTDETTEGNGVPTFTATIEGITDPSPYYLIDFLSDTTTVWNHQCTQSVPGFTQGPCSGEPTLMEMAFDPANNSSGLIRQVGQFSSISVGGYVVSGTAYTTELCLANGDCKIVIVNAVDTVTEDNWRLGQDGTYGILGFGPNSDIWRGFTDYDTQTATYSLELARLTPFTIHEHALQQTQQTSSNITLGGANADAYIGMTSVNVTANAGYTYDLNDFAFGLIYYDDQGVAYEQSYDYLSTAYPVEFTTNFQGLGLPGELYTNVTDLLSIISSGDISCSTERDGSCLMPLPCKNYTKFEDYVFMFNLTGEASNNYMRVPLATFSYNVKVSGGASQCNIQVSYLDPADAQSSNIILGGMYFQEFFGLFENNYSTTPTTQFASFYVGQNSIYKAYVGNVVLPEGKDPFAVPTNFTAKIDNFMVTVSASVQGQGPYQFNLESIGSQNYIWGSECSQSLGDVPNSACTSSPTFVLENINDKILQGGGATMFNTQGGYDSYGELVTGNVTLWSYGTQYTSVHDTFVAEKIFADGWNYGSAVSSGSVSVSIDSAAVNAFRTNMTSGFSIESGPVTDQSFAGGSPVTNTPQLYIGEGNYDNIYKPDQNQVIVIATPQNTYNLKSVGFGVLNFDQQSGAPSDGYFYSLGYTNVASTAKIVPNFKGLGLPTYYWYQVVNFLYHTPVTGWNCSASNGGTCVLPGSCSNYASLWQYSFKILFEGNTNYINMPLGALAYNSGSQCEIFVQFLDEGNEPQSDEVIFGAMFQQQFINYWHYNYTDPAVNVTTLYMQMSPNNTLTGSYIGSGAYANGANPFTNLVGTTQQFYVHHDHTWMSSSILASVGYQGNSYFGVGLFTEFVQTFSTECLYQHSSTGATRNTPCNQYPVYAENYFDVSDYQYVYPALADYEGLETHGDVYNTSICLSNSTTIDVFCSLTNNKTYVITSVENDNWNFGSEVGAGTIPLGWGSSIWSQFDWPLTIQYDVYFANFNNATNWAATPAQSVTSESVININGYDSSYDADNFIQVQSTSGNPGGSKFELSEFGFGLTSTKSNDAYYYDLMNSNPEWFNQSTNLTSLQMNFRGLGLPTQLYLEFTNLFSIITAGEGTCLDGPGGYCALPQNCEAYNDKGLWDYDFKIKFATGGDQYLRIPLTTIAADFYNYNGLCAVFVEYLEASVSDSKQIILGGMFLQSLYARIESTETATNLKLYVNKNAPSSTYLGNAVVTQGADPFEVQVKHIPTDPMSEKNGLPTFRANIVGNDVEGYYYMDFTADHTLVWQDNCFQTGHGSFPSGLCENAPTLMDTAFNPDNNSTGILHASGTFQDANYAGYTVSGTKYDTSVCIQSACKFVQVWSVDTVTEDNWLFDENGAYGVIGMGPASKLWAGFADPITNIVTYSISLGRVSFTGSEQPSNITFGSANDAAYTGMTNMQISSEVDFTYSYTLQSLEIGIVYQTDGVDSSEYFQAVPSDRNVIFTTNFQGIGLPANVYENVTSYLEILFKGDIECVATQDGVCTLPNACSEYTSFEDYALRFNFTSTTGNYMRVPLATFAQEVNIQGDKKCMLEIAYLDTFNSQSSQIIMGGMFFQEFFAVFENDLNMDPIQQDATIYKNENALYNSYVGNEMLPQGANPFAPPVPPTPEDKKHIGWIIALVIVCVLLLAGLGVLGYMQWKKSQGGTGGDVRPVSEVSEQQRLTNQAADEES